MIKAVVRNPLTGTTLLALGLTPGNMQKLLDNQPILLKLRELAPDLPNMEIVLIGGTQHSIMEDLRAMGIVVPDVPLQED